MCYSSFSRKTLWVPTFTSYWLFSAITLFQIVAAAQNSFISLYVNFPALRYGNVPITVRWH